MSVTANPPVPPRIRPLNPANYRPALLNVGTIVWLSSELMFFSGLFAAYFSLRAVTKVWPPEGDHLEVPTVAIATLILLLSSFTMQAGVRATLREAKGAWLGWLALTFVLGLTFDVMQGFDWYGRNFPLDQSAYSSCFYILTGFHALHVLGGLVAMIIVGIRSWKSNHFGHRTVPTVEMLSYYWHFVDIVWIALFAMIFLLQ